jgi:hypothetical protein
MAGLRSVDSRGRLSSHYCYQQLNLKYPAFFRPISDFEFLPPDA